MAGAQITLGVLEVVDDREESLLDVVEAVVVHRFLEALEANADRPIGRRFAQTVSGVDEYIVPDAERPDDVAGPE
jgi:hypothetical protein